MKKHSSLKTKFGIIPLLLLCGIPFCSMSLRAVDAKNQEQIKVDQTGDVLCTLAKYEIDAFLLLEQAITNIKNETIKKSLIEAKNDCEKNINDLSDLIRKYGKEPPKRTPDFKGYFMKIHEALRGLTSDTGLMKALHANLKLLMHGYEDAKKKDLPADAKEKVNKMHDDANKHLEYVKSQCKD